MLYSIRSERLLMEEIEYNILFRWFVGVNLDEEVWDETVFSKNRDRLLEADVAKQFFQQVVEQLRVQDFTSNEHFTVDGTLLEAWAGAWLKSQRGHVVWDLCASSAGASGWSSYPPTLRN